MNELRKLIALSTEEKREKGIEYTLAEIESQPQLWMKNLEMLRKRREEIESFLKEKTFSKNNPRVILTGAGSSAYIGLSVQNLLRYRWQLDVDTKPTTDIVTHWNSILLRNADNTMISFSRSGNSPESIGALLIAEKFCPSISHIIVTCNKNGRLAKLGREKENTLLLILSEETNDKGLAMTSSFTTMLMTSQFLAHINDPEEYEPIIRDLSEATRILFKDYSSLIKETAESNFNRAIFLGSSCLHGCAVESSLKLQEMTGGRIICKADTFLGVRHGPEAVINERTLVIYFLSTDTFVRRYELDLMEDVKTKDLGMKKIVVCDKMNREIEECVDYGIEFNKDGAFSIPDFYRPLMDVTIGQLLGLFKSLALGLKPDNPSEKGVITRVVKGVRIYDNETFKKDRRFKVLVN